MTVTLETDGHSAVFPSPNLTGVGVLRGQELDRWIELEWSDTECRARESSTVPVDVEMRRSYPERGRVFLLVDGVGPVGMFPPERRLTVYVPGGSREFQLLLEVPGSRGMELKYGPPVVVQVQNPMESVVVVE